MLNPNRPVLSVTDPATSHPDAVFCHRLRCHQVSGVDPSALVVPTSASSLWRSEGIVISGLVDLEWLHVLTPDAEDGGALGPSLRALRRDGVLAHVFGPHSKNQQGTHPTGVGDVVVGVCVQADVISVPGDPRFGVARHRTAHVALVAFGRVVKLQWDDKDWWTLHVPIPECWRAQHKPLCGGRDKHRHRVYFLLFEGGRRRQSTPFFFSVPQVGDSEGAEMPMSFFA